MLRAEWGSSKGRVLCPACNKSLHFSPPYPLIILLGSFPVFLYFLLTRGIREGWFSSIKMLLAWVVGSVLVSVYISQIKPPVLKPSPPDNDAPIESLKREDK
jgi:hypothetical protein